VSTLDAALARFETESNQSQRDTMLLLQKILQGQTYTISTLKLSNAPPDHEPKLNTAEPPFSSNREPGTGTGISSRQPVVVADQSLVKPPYLQSSASLLEHSEHAKPESSRSRTFTTVEIRERVRTSILSPSYCKCQCHNLRVSATPQIFTKTLGRLVIGISGQLSSEPRCNLATCDDQSRYTLTVTYYFPSWWVARAIILRCVQKPCGSPSFSLQTRDILPEHSPLLNAITEGQIDNLRTIFSNRICSPNAMEPMGWTGLTVSGMSF
jgi:hypothetical protein